MGTPPASSGCFFLCPFRNFLLEIVQAQVLLDHVLPLPTLHLVQFWGVSTEPHSPTCMTRALGPYPTPLASFSVSSVRRDDPGPSPDINQQDPTVISGAVTPKPPRGAPTAHQAWILELRGHSE